MIHRHFLAALIVSLAACQSAFAQGVYTDPNTGVQYRESKQVFKRPVTETRIEERPYTVLTEHVSTEYHPSYRNIYSPVTEYSWEPYLANRWNPFSQPTVNYRYVPHTRWEMRTEATQIPLTRHDVIPEQRVAQIPVTSTKLVDEEHITRIALSGGSDPFSNTAVASRPIGGVSTLSQDPPRQANTFVDRR